MRSPLLSAMRFVGHRGASHIAPENTMAAFRAATARGAGFECDLQTMRDGTLLVLHDDTLLRTATAPPDLTDAAARRFRELFARAVPAIAEATGIEWWTHRRPHGAGHQLHFDSADEGAGADGIGRAHV